MGGGATDGISEKANKHLLQLAAGDQEKPWGTKKGLSYHSNKQLQGNVVDLGIRWIRQANVRPNGGEDMCAQICLYPVSGHSVMQVRSSPVGWKGLGLEISL